LVSLPNDVAGDLGLPFVLLLCARSDAEEGGSSGWRDELIGDTPPPRTVVPVLLKLGGVVPVVVYPSPIRLPLPDAAPGPTKGLVLEVGPWDGVVWGVEAGVDAGDMYSVPIDAWEGNTL